MGVETVPGVNLELLRMDKYELEKDKDALFRGEFEVVRELVAALPEGDAAKRECDKVMDKNQKYFYLICFTAYLRDQSKVAKDGITDEDKKAFCLTGGKVSTPTESLKLKDTFVSWMDTNASLRTICDDGKGKLQWER